MRWKLPFFVLVVAASPLTSQAQKTLVWTASIDDNAHIMTGTGGGPNANFVQEDGIINPLPGSPNSTPVSHGADNDYYFSGIYSVTIPGNTAFYGAYTPLAVVGANENSAERAFAAGDLDLRYHFNLAPADVTGRLLSVTFDANNLDDPSATNFDPRFGVEVYFNNVRVLDQVTIHPADVTSDRDFTTIAFTPASVDARTGPADNIVSLRGISYNGAGAGQGGGNWMGVDFVRLDSEPIPEPSSALMILCGALGIVPFLRRRA